MNILLSIFSVSLLVSLGQVCLKAGSAAFLGESSVFQIIFAMLKSPLIILGSLSFITGFFFWIIVLSKANLGAAYPVMIGVEFSLVVLFSAILLREPLNIGKLAGIIVILLGIVIISKNM